MVTGGNEADGLGVDTASGKSIDCLCRSWRCFTRAVGGRHAERSWRYPHKDQGDNWERLPLDLPADRVLFVASDS